MISDTRITVVIPTFNRAGMVEQAVESVLTQTLQPVEVIVVDDGSTDDTEQRLARFESISYVRQEHGGPGRARNTGMRLARGEYLAFLDSDDSLYPYKLELQARVFDTFRDVAMTYSECSAFDDAGFDEVWHLRTYHESAFRGAPAGYDHLFETSMDLEATELLRGLPIAPALTAGRRAYFGNIFDVYLQRTIVFTNSMMFRRAMLAEVGLAVPLMLYEGGTATTRKRFAERARKYLAKCAQLGHNELSLWCLSHMPGPLRRLGVTLVERRRRAA